MVLLAQISLSFLKQFPSALWGDTSYGLEVFGRIKYFHDNDEVCCFNFYYNIIYKEWSRDC